jgi:TRAP transporter 4TM/12TM fusion protein
VVVAAIIPAIMYYLATFFAIDIEALRKQLKGIPKDELPKVLDVIKQRGHLVIPIVILLALMFSGYSPTFSVFYAIISSLIVSFFRKDTRINVSRLIIGFKETAEGCIGVGAACSIVGIVIGIAGLTSIGTTLGNSIIDLANGNLMLLLIFTMIVTLILGMGVASVPAFILTSIVSASVLLEAGVNDLTSHMFILYFAILGTITPPVAITAYVAAGIAGSNPNKTGWTAFRLALPGFFIPFFFVYHPQMLLQNVDITFPLLIILNVVGIFTLTLSLQGYWMKPLRVFQRVLLFAITIAMIHPNLITSGIGLLIFIIFWFLQRKYKNTNHVPMQSETITN